MLYKLLKGVNQLANKKDINENINESDKVFRKVVLSWYPGHMAKTKKQIIEDLKLVDIVVELLDARIPISSQNPDIQEMTKNKKKLIVLNKSDLADEAQNQKWVSYFEQQGKPAVLADSNLGLGINQIMKKIEMMMQEEQQKLQQKGRTGKNIRMMIVGIPNVGKSSLINRMTKKTSAEVGNKPGITKQKQWVRISDGIELLDTPGVLWPKFQSEEVALHLSFTGTIKEEILDRVEVAYELTKFLLANYREQLCKRYQLDGKQVETILAQDEPEHNIYEVMLEIGRKRGCMVSGGAIDDEKVARILLDEFKNGKLGRITIEKREAFGKFC